MTRIQGLKEISKTAYKRGHVAAQLPMNVRWSVKDIKFKTGSRQNQQ